MEVEKDKKLEALIKKPQKVQKYYKIKIRK